MKGTLLSMFEQYSKMGKSRGGRSLPKERATSSCQPSQQHGEADFLTQMYMIHAGPRVKRSKVNWTST